jgi:hypothetical protein
LLMKKDRKYQKGQAIAEMVVSIVGLMAILLGMILVMEMSIARIDNIIEARGEADIAAYNGIYSSPGDDILYWDEGADEMMHTPDDTAVTGTSDFGDTFLGELSNGSFSLSSDLPPEYVEDNFARDYASGITFLAAAGLTSAEESTTISLSDAERILFNISPIQELEDTVYMPIIASEEAEE